MISRRIIVAIWLVAMATRGGADTPPCEQETWLDRLIPLPQEITVRGVVTVDTRRICVRTRPSPGSAEQAAAERLSGLWSGVVDQSEPCGPGRFEIQLGLLGGDGRLQGADLSAAADRLRSLPNADQAYVIRPLGDHGLVLVAIGEPGILFAAQTLRQLLTGQPSTGNITMPLVQVTDWPAIDQRGLWESVFERPELEWLASLKFSVVNVHARLQMSADGRGTVSPDMVRRLPAGTEPEYGVFCRELGMRCIPIITHLSHLSRTGIYDHYPEVRGQGEGASHPTKSSWVGPCTSEPALARVLADWMMALAGEHGAEEISVWLSEEQVRCSCERCLLVGQYVGETRAILAGWRLARALYPDLKLQLLLTQGSYEHNEEVLAEIPSGGDVRVVYYDGGRTYDASREPMIYPALEQFAAEGGWLGVYPQVTASWAFVLPWSAPQFIRERMKEFASKRLQAVIGYAVPAPLVHDFNVAATAEWSWHPTGRSAREFARAWATQRGITDPDAVAEWVDLLSPVSWDVYGSKFPLFFVWDDPAQFIRSGTVPPLGEYVFRYFDTPVDFDRGLAACARAAVIARQLGEDELLQETLITDGYLRMLQQLYLLSAQAAADSARAQPEKLREHLASLMAARDQVNGALRDWAPGRGVEEVSRFKGTLGVNDRMVEILSKAVRDHLNGGIE